MIAARLSGEMIRASKRAISRVHPDYSGDQIEDAFIELHQSGYIVVDPSIISLQPDAVACKLLSATLPSLVY